jgi:hypothetical protein
MYINIVAIVRFVASIVIAIGWDYDSVMIESIFGSYVKTNILIGSCISFLIVIIVDAMMHGPDCMLLFSTRLEGMQKSLSVASILTVGMSQICGLAVIKYFYGYRMINCFTFIVGIILMTPIGIIIGFLNWLEFLILELERVAKLYETHLANQNVAHEANRGARPWQRPWRRYNRQQ